MKKSNITIRSSAAEYLTYVAATGDNPESIEVRYEDENIWLTQKMLATVYDVSVSAINQHIKKIYEDNELEKDSTIKNFLIVQIVDKPQKIFLGFANTFFKFIYFLSFCKKYMKYAIFLSGFPYLFLLLLIFVTIFFMFCAAQISHV